MKMARLWFRQASRWSMQEEGYQPRNLRDYDL